MVQEICSQQQYLTDCVVDLLAGVAETGIGGFGQRRRFGQQSSIGLPAGLGAGRQC